MDTMTLIFIAPIIIVMIVVLVVLSRKNLQEVELRMNEKVLFEDTDCYFIMRHNGGQRSYRYKGFIRLTDQRILLFQKMLFGNGKVVSATIDYSGQTGPLKYSDMMGGFAFKKGYPELATEKKMIEFSDNEEKEIVVNLKANEVPLQIDQPKIIIRSSQPEIYKKHLG